MDHFWSLTIADRRFCAEMLVRELSATPISHATHHISPINSLFDVILVLDFSFSLFHYFRRFVYTFEPVQRQLTAELELATEISN